MGDWLDDLTPDERSEWDRFVDHVRRDALEKIAGSAVTVSILPPEGAETDVKFAVELGLSIMLGKPIIALVMPGRECPPKLAEVADEVIHADIDTEAGRERFHLALNRVLAGLDEEARP